MVSGQSYNSIFIYYIIGGYAYLSLKLETSASCITITLSIFLSNLIRLSLPESINTTTTPHHHNTNNTTSWAWTNITHKSRLRIWKTMDWRDYCRDRDEISGHYCPFMKILLGRNLDCCHHKKSMFGTFSCTKRRKLKFLLNWKSILNVPITINFF